MIPVYEKGQQVVYFYISATSLLNFDQKKKKKWPKQIVIDTNVENQTQFSLSIWTRLIVYWHKTVPRELVF